MLFYYKNKNVGSVTTSHTPTFIVEPFFHNNRIVSVKKQPELTALDRVFSSLSNFCAANPG